MAKYSYRCEECGFTVLSDDKAEIKAARESHRKKLTEAKNGVMVPVPKCLFMPTGRGTVARPDLAHKIQEKIYEAQ